VLLDEIEKAHPDVWNMLLQIMEEGRLTDNVGRVVDFKNTLVIMTTNIGAETIVAADDMSAPWLRGVKKDSEANYNDMQKKLRGRMEKEFRPEFLNRLDDIIVFRSLTKDDLKAIVNMELAKVSKRLGEKGLKLVVTDEAKDYLIEKGSSLEFGARPLRRAIEQHLEDMLAEELLKGTFHGSTALTVKVIEDGAEKKLSFDTDKAAAEAATPVVAAGQP
jgi:ATP-dependent Clp protease ATP-binding subunit ClpC